MKNISKKIVEILVGFFMLLGITALVFMAFKVSGLTVFSSKESYYKVFAEFDNIGSLKVRSPIMIAGVNVGQVGAIDLDPQNFRARTTLLIRKDHQLPIDTSANIYTQGLLGSNYVNLTPGFADSNLENGGVIESTQPAIVLEKLIGQFLYSLKGDNNKENPKEENKNETSI